MRLEVKRALNLKTWLCHWLLDNIEKSESDKPSASMRKKTARFDENKTNGISFPCLYRTANGIQKSKYCP
jgi:hypothetical protein